MRGSDLVETLNNLPDVHHGSLRLSGMSSKNRLFRTPVLSINIIYRLIGFVIAFSLLYHGKALGASAPPASSPPSTSSASPPPSPSSPSPQEDTNEAGTDTFASQTGKFGLSLMFQYNVLQTPAPILLFQNAVGGLGELSYGISNGIRILAGGGYMFNSPHVSPPLQRVVSPLSSGPSNQYAQAYAGIKLEFTRWFPSMIRYQPWFPYLRADSGGVFASISDAGPQTGHPNGLMEDLGFGIEGRPRAIPLAFFGEIRSQWLFMGPQVITVVPVFAGTTFFF